MRWLAFVVLAGCDSLFNLEQVDTVDAMVDATFEPCPASYTTPPNTTSRYRYVSLSLPWDAAEADCENDTQTRISHLVVFDDVAELIAVTASAPFERPWEASVGYARDTVAQGGVANEFYPVTSLRSLPLSSPLWAMSEPNNGLGGPEETTVFISHDTAMYDAPAIYPHTYICECDQQQPARIFHTID